MSPASTQVCLVRLAKGEKVALYIAPGSKRTPGAVVDAITELKAQEPVMAWSIECWHNELRAYASPSADGGVNLSTVGERRQQACVHQGNVNGNGTSRVDLVNERVDGCTGTWLLRWA